MPSEIVDSSRFTDVPDRRARKRDRRRDALLDLAADLVEKRGVDGLTMAALAEVSDYATASLYTYFPSRGALVSALQERALGVLADVGESRLAAWDESLGAVKGSRAGKVGAIARLWGFADLFLTAPDHHPREFHLQQELLVAPQSDDAPEAPLLAAAMAVLDLPRRLLARAVEVRALDAPKPVVNSAGEPVEAEMVRTLAWISAMNGALLLDRLDTGVAITGFALGVEITESLLRGWGADLAVVAEARARADDWRLR